MVGVDPAKKGPYAGTFKVGTPGFEPGAGHLAGTPTVSLPGLDGLVAVTAVERVGKRHASDDARSCSRTRDWHLGALGPSNQEAMTTGRSQVLLIDNGDVPPREGETVHAALVKLTIDPDQARAAANALTHEILPTIRSAPGFVAGYWLEPVGGQGISFVVFETEEQARRSAPPASNWAAPGVSINDVDFRRVAASA